MMIRKRDDEGDENEGSGKREIITERGKRERGRQGRNIQRNMKVNRRKGETEEVERGREKRRIKVEIDRIGNVENVKKSGVKRKK